MCLYRDQWLGGELEIVNGGYSWFDFVRVDNWSSSPPIFIGWASVSTIF